MPNIDTGKNVIEERAKAAIKRYYNIIVNRFCEGAKKEGHNIKPQNVTAVTYGGLQNLTFSVVDFHLGNFVIEDPQDLVYLDGTSWDNNASTQADTSFNVGEVTTDSYTWSMTAGVKFGVSVSDTLEFGIPGAKETVKAEVSVEASASTTHGTAYSKAHHWDKKFEQQVKPYSHFELYIYGQQVKGHVPYTITAEATGKALVKIVFNYYGSRQHTEKVNLTELLHESGIKVVHSGIISGLQGYKWYLDSHDRPLNEDEKTHLPNGVTKISVQPDIFKSLAP